jgi:hypothetical protein
MKVTLVKPIERAGEQEPVTAVTIQKPSTGALRGLKLTDVLQMDVNAMIRLLPRITEPSLLPAEVEALDPADFLALASEVAGFFATPEDLRAIRESRLG